MAADTSYGNVLGKTYVLFNAFSIELKADLLAFDRILERRPLTTATTDSKVICQICYHLSLGDQVFIAAHQYTFDRGGDCVKRSALYKNKPALYLKLLTVINVSSTNNVKFALYIRVEKFGEIKMIG